MVRVLSLKDGLTALLYTLMRDLVVPGEVERLVRDLEARPGPYDYSNRHLASYAGELADRIRGAGE